MNAAWSLDVDEYIGLRPEGRASVDRWLTEHELLDKRVYYVEVNEDLIVRAHCYATNKDGRMYRDDTGDIARAWWAVPLRVAPPRRTV
jgi:hypothetical protein